MLGHGSSLSSDEVVSWFLVGDRGPRDEWKALGCKSEAACLVAEPSARSTAASESEIFARI